LLGTIGPFVHPRASFFVRHHAGLSHITVDNYLRNYDFIYLAFDFVRVVALFAAANWFYKAGPRVENFFFAGEATGND
jgi:hypothetical protein